VLAWLARALSRRTPAEQNRADHDAGDSSHGGQLTVNRERQQEREHDQHCANTDQGRGHGITLCLGEEVPANATPTQPSRDAHAGTVGHDRRVTNNIRDRLIERLTPLMASADGVIILERVARAAGATRWFYCRSMAEVEELLPSFRWGSRVGFFFDNRIRRQPFSEEVGEQITDIATVTGEVLLGREGPAEPELEMDFLSPDELPERLAGLRVDEVVYYGAFPAMDEDGVSAVSYTPPDDDGIVRPQPV
jgi:hypothetical protein